MNALSVVNFREILKIKMINDDEKSIYYMEMALNSSKLGELLSHQQ